MDLDRLIELGDGRLFYKGNGIRRIVENRAVDCLCCFHIFLTVFHPL